MAAAVVLATTVLPVCAGLSIAQKEERRHEIDRLEDAWRSAVLSSNTKALDALLADDYMAINPSGTIQTKDDTLQGIRTGRFHIASLIMSDRKVRFYGETAVVTSLAEIQGVVAGSPLTGSYRYTRVYVRNAQGQWKIVSFEASQISDSGPHKRNELH
ncbi:MAG: nuclear transport factor 2 family protein [Terracidiphilus sp.]